MTNTNNRKHKRRHLLFYLKIFDRISGTLVGNLVDITIEGLKLVSDRKIAKDTILSLQMELPTEILDKKKIIIKAKAMWCTPDINPIYFATGLQFIDLSPDESDIIVSLIAQYGFPYR